MSPSPSPALPALAGIAPLPPTTDLTNASLPVATRGAHAALSPNFGALATPVAWHATQVDSYTALPSAASATEATAPSATASALHTNVLIICLSSVGDRTSSSGSKAHAACTARDPRTDERLRARKVWL